MTHESPEDAVFNAKAHGTGGPVPQHPLMTASHWKL